MATEFSTFDPARRTDYQAANNAIDGVLASQSHSLKTDKLRKQYKKSEFAYKMSNRRVQARGDAVERTAEGLEGQAESIKTRNAQIEQAKNDLTHLENEWKYKAEASVDTWQEEFNSKNKYRPEKFKNDKQRNAAWQDFYEKRSYGMPEYRTTEAQRALIERMIAGSNSARGGYQSGVNKVKAQTKRYKKGTQAAKRAYARYEAALGAYNAHNSYTPFQRGGSENIHY